MNVLYDLGVKDDKFALVSALNDKCVVSIKTPVGQTEEFILNNIEMQGTVSAPLKCTGQIDSLGRSGYRSQVALYNYNQNCFVPILGMIDDTLGMSVCGKDSVELNAFINSTIQSKKLYFNTLKCHKIHIGPRKDECPVLKVHGEEMKDSVAEKYLGDIVSAKGNDENIKSRRKTGFQAMSEMMSVLKEVAAGFYVSIGIILRDAILVSKLLLNSEVWHGLTVKQTDSLEQLDRIYLRNILRAHPKVGLECIYIDAGKLPLKYHIKFRRMMYLWQILHLEKTELVSRIFTSQKLEPKFGDWVKSIEKDKSDLLIDMDDSDIARQSKNKFRNYVKSKVKSLATHDLKEIKQKHSKSSKMELKNLETAKYLKDPRLNKSEQQLLFS